MNPKTVIKLLSYVMLVMALFMVIPLLIAHFNGEEEAYMAFLTTECLLLFSAILILLYLRGEDAAKELSIKDSYVFVTLTWLTVTFFGSIPYYMTEATMSFAESFFETMSGFTTTGATAIPNINEKPESILFWRNMTNWIGGMGIIVLFVALLPAVGVRGTALVGAETVGPTKDKLTPQIQSTAMALWLIYLALTVAQTILLLLGGLSIFDASAVAFGTIAAAGFAPREGSIAAYSSHYVEWVCTIFMFLSGTNFALFFKLFQGKFKRVAHDGEFRLYIKLILVFSILVSINLYTNSVAGIMDSIRLGFFHVISFITTTGFASANYSSWPMFSQIVLFVLLFIGGCAGSAGGGIKVIRVKVLYQMGTNATLKRIHPNAVTNVKVGDSIISEETCSSIAGFIGLYLVTIFIGTLVISLSGRDFLTCFTGVLLTLGNNGVGIGTLGTTECFDQFSSFYLWAFSFLMLAGRLELFTVYSLFTRRFWAN